MVARSKRKIAYALLQKFKDAYLEWIEEKKHSDEIVPTEEELKELKPRPFITMVFSVGSNNEKIYIPPQPKKRSIQQRYGARGKCWGKHLKKRGAYSFYPCLQKAKFCVEVCHLLEQNVKGSEKCATFLHSHFLAKPLILPLFSFSLRSLVFENSAVPIFAFHNFSRIVTKFFRRIFRPHTNFFTKKY